MSGIAFSNGPSARETVCLEANRIVYGDREQTYDHPSRNFVRTAHIWNGYLKARYPDINVELDEFDVARMMVGLKLARQIHAPKRDNIVDAIGYFACEQKIVEANEDLAARAALRQFDPVPE